MSNKFYSNSTKRKLSKQESFNEIEKEACKLAPKIDGRILLATDEVSQSTF